MIPFKRRPTVCPGAGGEGRCGVERGGVGRVHCPKWTVGAGGAESTLWKGTSRRGGEGIGGGGGPAGG